MTNVPEITVAIADPHPVLCEGLAAYLQEIPEFRIVGYASALPQVTELVTSQRPQLLVLDSEFGESPELVDALASMHEPPAIVLLTCTEDSDSVSNAIGYGALGFVLKVAPLDDIATALRWTSQGQMWISPPLLSTFFSISRNRTPNVRNGHDRLSALTEREFEILELMVEGLTHAEIADRLHVAVNTVRTHTRNIQMKLLVHSNLAAVSVALDAGLRPR